MTVRQGVTVYRVCCSVNDKLYFGMTSTSLDVRKRKHLQAAKTSDFRFHRALRKHGNAAFLWEAVAVNLTWGEACSLERELIRSHSSRDPDKGYNDTDGGEGRYGKKASEATRAKMSASQKGRVLTAEHRQKLKDAWQRRAPMSDQTRQKMSQSRKGKAMNFTEEALSRIGAANRGRPGVGKGEKRGLRA